MEFFKGRTLVIATKHRKESVIAPKAREKLGVKIQIPAGFDTDVLGTFSGEIERKQDPLSTLRKKCTMALEFTGADLCIGSEGSFGPHPSIPFIAANEEFVMLIDKKNGLEILGKKLSPDTNFDGELCPTKELLLEFAEKVHFPSHALILRNKKGSNKKIFKGITEKKELLEKFQLLKKQYGQAFAETDMRAMVNPTRMKVIAVAADAMLEKATTTCENCKMPGFGITDALPGLKCSNCGLRTKSVSAYIHSCAKCGFRKEVPRTEKLLEDPTYCDFCNP
ncbi:MAG: DUF6671 family protein [Gillisia sp.]